jgi:hypothetical protein
LFLELALGMVGQIKCAESAISAISPLLMCRIGGPLPIGAVLLSRRGDKRDDLLPTEVGVCERPVCHPASVSSGLGWPRDVSGGVVFPELSKLLSQEDALGAPCLNTMIPALRRRALAGRRNAADRRNPSLRCHTTVCYTGHQAGKR